MTEPSSNQNIQTQHTNAMDRINDILISVQDDAFSEGVGHCHQWLLTNKVLPPTDIPVLCYQEIYGRSVGVMDELGVFRFSHDGDTLRPSHWMPLPDIPASKDEGE